MNHKKINISENNLQNEQTAQFEEVFATYVIEKCLIIRTYTQNGASLVTQTVKNPPAMQESQVGFLGWEYSPEKGLATHSGILAQEIPWTEEPGRLQSMGSQRVGHN